MSDKDLDELSAYQLKAQVAELQAHELEFQRETFRIHQELKARVAELEGSCVNAESNRLEVEAAGIVEHDRMQDQLEAKTAQAEAWRFAATELAANMQFCSGPCRGGDKRLLREARALEAAGETMTRERNDLTKRLAAKAAQVKAWRTAALVTDPMEQLLAIEIALDIEESGEPVLSETETTRTAQDDPDIDHSSNHCPHDSLAPCTGSGHAEESWCASCERCACEIEVGTT